MRARLLSGVLLFVLAVTIALELPLGFVLQTREVTTAHNNLRRAAGALAVLVADALDHNEPARAREVASDYVGDSQLQAAVVDAGRVVLATSASARATLAAPGIVRAVRGDPASVVAGQAGRPPVLFAARSVDERRPDGTVRRAVLVVTEPVEVVNDLVNGGWLKLALLGAAVLVAATVLALVLSASLIRPLRRIEAAVTAIGAGQLDARAPVDSGPAELRTLAAALNSTAARLHRLLDAQRAFAANASHQLRTPLTAIRLQLEHALQREHAGSVLASARARAGGDAAPDLDLDPRPDGGAGNEIEAALDEVRRLSRMVSALLELARDEAHQPVLARIDVSAAIEERLEAWRPLAEEQGLRLIGAAQQPALVALVVPEALEQVLDNLLANAFEATPAGGTVEVSVSGQGSFAEVHVLDDGSGLAEGEHARAFDRFWRGARSRPDGSGLGLAIVDHLVRMSGGSAELRERAEGGTDAVVWLPLA